MSWLSQVTGSDAMKNGGKMQEQAAQRLKEQNQKLGLLYDESLAGYRNYADLAANPYAEYENLFGPGSEMYRNAYGYDPYSEELNAMRTGMNQDAVAGELERTLQSISNNPYGGGDSSIQQNGAVQARLKAMMANGDFARALKVKGGEERASRYARQLSEQSQGYMQRQNGKLQAGSYLASMPLNIQGMMSGNIGGLANAGAAMVQQGQGQAQGIANVAGTVAGAIMGGGLGGRKSAPPPPQTTNLLGQGASILGTNLNAANPFNGVLPNPYDRYGMNVDTRMGDTR